MALATIIKTYRGTAAGIPALADGQLGWATDTHVLYCGQGGVNYAVSGSSYTDEQAQDAIGTILLDSSRINFTYDDGTPSITADLISDTITAGYLHASATDVLFGRSTAGAGAGEEIACTSAGRALLDDANAAAQRTTLGLGTVAVQDAESIAITGGSITGIADLALADGGTGASLSDPNADRILFWDDSGGAVTWLTAGTGLSISGTTINCTISAISDGDKGDITVSGSGATWTIDTAAVTYAKIQNVAGLSVFGRASNSSGVGADITAVTDGHALRLSGTTLGFGTLAAGAFADHTISYARLSQINALRVLGNPTNATADVQEITAAGGATPSDGQCLRVVGSNLLFGALNLATTAAVTGVLDETNGGTGQNSCTTGDILYGSASNVLSKLAIGSESKVLTVKSGIPQWISTQTGNHLINGGMDYHQRQAPGTATARSNDTYGPDRWVILTQTASVTNEQSTGGPYARYAAKLTQTQASAQRFGLLQIVEGINSRHLRSKDVIFTCAVKISNSQAVRVAVLEWTGTEDSVTSDVVNDWTSSTYTAGNFFLGSNLTVTGVASSTPSAATWTVLNVTGTASSSCNNFAVMIWTEGTAAQNVTLEVSECGLYEGTASSRTWIPRLTEVELALCQRYYEVGQPGLSPTRNSDYDLEMTCVGTTTANGVQYGQWPYLVAKRVSPTVTIHPYTTGTDTGKVSNSVGTDLAASSGASVGGINRLALQNNSGGTVTHNGLILFKYEADAEL